MKARHKDTGEIIELAEEGIISRDGRRFCWYQVELIPEPIDESKVSLPSELDEAAEQYALDSKAKPFGNISKESFKGGAKWMAGQGQTFEAHVDNGCAIASGVELPFVLWDTYKDGDVLKVQIRKKQ